MSLDYIALGEFLLENLDRLNDPNLTLEGIMKLEERANVISREKGLPIINCLVLYISRVKDEFIRRNGISTKNSGLTIKSSLSRELPPIGKVVTSKDLRAVNTVIQASQREINASSATSGVGGKITK